MRNRLFILTTIKSAWSLYIHLSLIVLALLPTPFYVCANTDRPTLYAPGDNVVELDVSNFNKTVYHQPKAFFIEFYSSWCGHCIEYKPLFVRFATMVKDWHNAVVIAVINCADEINAPVCREHSVDAFPMLKYFHANANSKDDSIKFDDNKRDLPMMANKITEWVKADYDKGLAPTIGWPRLQFEDHDKTLIQLWSNLNAHTHLLAIVVDKEPATNAFSLMLNYAGDNRIGISLCSPDHPIAAHFNNIKTPGMFVFLSDNKEQSVYRSNDALESWIEMQKELDQLLAPYPKQLAALSEKERNEQQLQQPPTDAWNQFEVQYQDLIASMYYLFTNEIPRKPVIGDLELKALKGFIHLMRKHGPGSVPVRRLFYRLDEWFSAQKEEAIKVENYLTKLEEIQTDLGHPIPSNVSYLACQGSKPHLRGYTCGLWTIFHILTVRAYIDRKDDSKYNPVEEVLEPIHKFVFQFLSCDVCAKNFDNMTKNDGLDDVKKAEDTILWLWRAHNKVNKRLSGAKSEDPKFPKQQFPPTSICPECRKPGTDEFDDQKVLHFMIKYYSDVKIDKYKPAPTYKVTEYADGKLQKQAIRRLNPKFEPMAGKVDKLEEIEAKIRAQQETDVNRPWAPIGDDLRGISERTNFHFVWLTLIAVALIIAYFQYRRNRSKFWKTFYYYKFDGNYKVLPTWHMSTATSLSGKDLHNA